MATPYDTIKQAIIGNPPQLTKKPSRQGVVKAFAEMQLQLEAAQAGAICKATKSDLLALTVVPYANIMAWVTNDPVIANNGIYRNIGGPTTPNFIRQTSIPQFFVSGMNTGAGTANNIIATSDLPVPSEDGRAIVGVNITTTNADGTVTLTLNGVSYAVISNSGNPINASGTLVAGTVIIGVITGAGTQFRMLSDQAAASMLTAMEALYENFNALFLGAKATAPTVDNLGNPLQDGALYYNTTSGIVFVRSGATWQAMNATVADNTITDPKIAAGSLLRNRNLDVVHLSDFMSVSLQDDYRSGANPDITQALIDMDAALSPNGEAFYTIRNAVLSGNIPKKRGTRWRAIGSNVLAAWSNIYNGSVFSIDGGASSASGGVFGMRVNNDPILCPNAILFDLDQVFTHFFDDIRAGFFDFVVYGIDCKALRFGMNFYPFSCLTDAVMLEGTSITANTDHCFADAQMDGARAGLHIKTGATPRFAGMTRPQGSGVGNLILDNVYDAQIIGGYNDSAIIFGDDDGGDGIRMLNCQRCRVALVHFYSNGDNEDATRAMIRILTVDGVSADIYLTQNSMFESPLAPMVGIAISTPTGFTNPPTNTIPSYNRRLFIEGNKLNGVTTKISGLANVGAGGRVKDNDSLSDLLGVGDNGSTPITIGANVKIVRITGQNVNRDLILPGEGNYNSKELQVWFESGTGTVTIKQSNGSTTLTTQVTGSRRTYVVTTQNNTIASTVWA